jgi:hypothetical protein
VATYSTGVAISWDGTDFGEVFALSWSFGGDRQDRGSGSTGGWTQEPGTITFSCYSVTGVTATKLGKRAAFSITGGGMGHAGDAILQSVDVDAQLNGCVRYTVTLKYLN